MPSDLNRRQPPDHRRPRPRPRRRHAPGRRLPRRRLRPAHDRRRDLFSDITPCNAHLDRLARKGCEGVRAAGGVPQSSAPRPPPTAS